MSALAFSLNHTNEQLFVWGAGGPVVRAHGMRAKSGAGDCGSNPCPAATLNGFGDFFLKKSKKRNIYIYIFLLLLFSLAPPLFHLDLSLPSPPSPLNPPFISLVCVSQSLLSLPLMLFDCCVLSPQEFLHVSPCFTERSLWASGIHPCCHALCLVYRPRYFAVPTAFSLSLVWSPHTEVGLEPMPLP